MRTRHIVKCAVCKILERPGHAGRRVVLHGRHVDDFRHLVRDYVRHVGASFPLSKEIGVAVDVRFVLASGRECLLNSNDANTGR